MNGRTLSFIFIFISFCALLWAKSNVAVMYNKKVKLYQNIADEFKSILVVEGHKVTQVEYKSEPSKALKALKKLKPDFLFSIGAGASKVAFQAEIPGVFTMVVDPVKAGLVDTDGYPLGKLSGVLVNIKGESQFKVLQDLLGHRVKGVCLFDPKISAFMVDNYKRDAESFGFQMDLVEVHSKSEVPPALPKIRKGNDFIFSVVDNTVYNSKNISIILRFSLTNKIPLIGFSPQQAKAGALVGFYCDYSSLGGQAGDLLLKIMANDSNISNIPVELPKKMKYALNRTSAAIMKIKLPDSIKRHADKIYGS